MEGTMNKYVDFANIDDILVDLTPGEAKEMEDIENKYLMAFEKWKLEEIKLRPENPPKNWDEEGYLPINKEEEKEWNEYEEKGSKEWHEKRDEWININEAFNEERSVFFDKFQERRFTEMIKKVGIDKFFLDRIKAAEEAIKKVTEENGKSDTTRIYTDYGLNRILGSYNEVIEVSKEVLKKVETIKKENIQNLSFSEILEIIKNQDIGLEADRFLQDYAYLPNSPITKFIKNVSIAKSNTKSNKIPVNKNTKVQETIDLEGGKGIYAYITKNENYEIIFKDLKALKTRQSIAFRKTLNFILIKANEQNVPRQIYFDLEEYQNMAGYKNKDTAYRGAVKNFETLRGLSVGGTITRGKKEIRNKTSYVFISKDITYNQCYIECKPELVEMLSQYFTLLPCWAGELSTKPYDLLDYVFYMARQSQNLKNIKDKKIFNVGLKAINENIGGHEPEATQRHTEYIIDPILNAIEEIEVIQAAAQRTNIKITPIYNFDYKNAYDFLEGYLEIELDEEAINYYIDRNEAQIKRIKKVLARAEK